MTKVSQKTSNPSLRLKYCQLETYVRKMETNKRRMMTKKAVLEVNLAKKLIAKDFEILHGEISQIGFTHIESMIRVMNKLHLHFHLEKIKNDTWQIMLKSEIDEVL